MKSALTWTRNYVSHHRHSFWKWGENGNVVCWEDGRVIAFREELVAVLAHLVPEGLPSFRSVLLILAATRSSWKDGPANATPLWSRLRETSSTYSDEGIFQVVVDQLNGVHDLPESERESLAAKCVLVESIFEGVQRALPPSTSASIVSFLTESPNEVFDLEPLITSRGEDEHFDSDIAHLSFGLLGISGEALQLRRDTGLESLPTSAEEELSAVAKVRALLANHTDDKELRGIVALALRLMAAVTLPRPVSAVDELQMGGVSDISNRGPLDRLLLSELAHEKLTLAVRVAMNEALYLRRESPPKSPATRRVLFLDTGIRTWGLPRVFATSVALALAATARPDAELSVYRATGTDVENVDLTSRAGLVDHLGFLHHHIHPGQALAALFDRVEECDEQVEVVVVTTADTLADLSFQRELGNHNADTFLIAAVDRDGHMQLSERSRSGNKLIKEVRLDLESLLEEPPSLRHSLVDPKVKKLPAIFSCDPFPLRLPAWPNTKMTAPLEVGGIIGVTKDRRLMWWQNRGIGAMQLATKMPSGKIWWSTSNVRTYQAQLILSTDDGSNAQLLTADLEQPKCNTVGLELENRPSAMFVSDGSVFAIQDSHVWILSVTTGEKLGSIRVPRGIRWVRDRFFRDTKNRQWLVPTFDGSRGWLSVVLDEQRDGSPELIALVDCPHREGVVGITEHGHPFFSDERRTIETSHSVPGQARVYAVDPEGRKVAIVSVLAHQTSAAAVLIDMVDQSAEVRTMTPHYFVDAAIQTYAGQANIRHRFTGVYVNAQGLLTLVSTKQQHVSIDLNHTAREIVLTHDYAPATPYNLRLFTELLSRQECGFQLRKTQWDDGSEAFLDSRGLLHLRSSDRSIPEMSIALLDGPLGGWCSDGRLWGDAFVTGRPSSTSPSLLYRGVIKTFVGQLR